MFEHNEILIAECEKNAPSYSAYETDFITAALGAIPDFKDIPHGEKEAAHHINSESPLVALNRLMTY